MKLSDVMGGAGLAGYAEVAMILFFFVFLAVAVRVLSRGHRAEWEHASQLPLCDGAAGENQTSAPSEDV